METSIITKDELEYRLRFANEEGYQYQERRHDDWQDNYTLGRNKVIYNRLTQRQSVNLPIMKGTMKTLLSKISDFVELEFTNLDNDKQKELFFNQYWSDIVVKDNHLELKDKADKKQVLTFGRTFEKWNVMNGKIKLHIVSPWDMRVDKLIDPTDIDSGRYLIQGNIFSSISDLKLNDLYDQKEIETIESYFQSDEGLILSSENAEKMIDKNEVAKQMGDEEMPLPQVGQTLVELQESYLKVYNPEIDDEEIVFAVSTAFQGTNHILFADFLETVIGETKDHYWRHHFPFGSWAEDLDNADFWSDGPADSVRTSNKIANAWFSQMVENRTLAYLGMNYYDNTAGAAEDGSTGFIPETFELEPFGWYGVPGNPNEIIKSVTIPQLANETGNIEFVIGVAEKASNATSISQGVSEAKKITLGEVELLDSNVTQIIQSMGLFYRQNWLDLGEKYVKIVEALGDKLEAVKLFKKGYRGNIFSRNISAYDWRSESGYSVEVISKKDKSSQNMEQIQNLASVETKFPNNNSYKKIYKKKLLDIVALTPDEKREVMAEEEKNDELAKQQSNLLISDPTKTTAPSLMPTNTPAPMATA